jgi:hypothetical protein
VGVKAKIPAVALTVLALSAAPADAQRTRFQGLTQCSRLAAAQFGRQDSSFRRFVIERMSVHEERYAGLVGNQFISTVYYGRATYENAAGPKRARFICLHAGYSKGAVFIYAMPE